MNKPTLQADGTILCPQGFGYWDLTHYPWGGSFHRFTEDCTADLSGVFDTYRNGQPRKIKAQLGNKTIGIELQ